MVLTFCIGLMIGGFFGMLIGALCAAAARSEHQPTEV